MLVGAAPAPDGSGARTATSISDAAPRRWTGARALARMPSSARVALIAAGASVSCSVGDRQPWWARTPS